MDSSELALWRYSVIAPLLHRGADVSATGMARDLAGQVKQGPDGVPVTLSAETLLRWWRAYLSGGLPALENRLRADRGRPRALDDQAVATLLDLVGEHPDWTTKAIHRQAQITLGRAVPIKPVYRLLAGHRRVPEPPEARRRPVGVPQVLWLADTMHGISVWGPNRKKRKTYLIAIMDDASRAIMAGQFVFTDDVAALIPIFREAVLARGCPARFLTDNGANYRSRVFRTACATLGIELVYAPPRRATYKARLERFFLTVRLKFLPMLPASPSLEDLRAAWARFLAAYHAEPHRTLSELSGKPTSPLDYYLTHLPADVRQVSEVSLDQLLLVEETRRVNPDSTIRVAGKVFEVRAHLAGSHVSVRFNPANAAKVLYRPLKDSQASFEEAFPID
jgi:putative transposase